jgi:hypothetical protein
MAVQRIRHMLAVQHELSCACSFSLRQWVCRWRLHIDAGVADGNPLLHLLCHSVVTGLLRFLKDVGYTLASGAVCEESQHHCAASWVAPFLC